MPIRVELEQLIEMVRALPFGDVLKIEGMSGSGKTTLARTLAEATGVTVIHVDDFVVQGPDALPYWQRIDYKALDERVIQARCNEQGAIIEGICLEVVMRKLKLDYADAVYVRRISSGGVWHDGLHIEDYRSGRRAALTEPHLSDMRYHLLHAPHLTVEIHYPRFDD